MVHMNNLQNYFDRRIVFCMKKMLFCMAICKTEL